MESGHTCKVFFYTFLIQWIGVGGLGLIWDNVPTALFPIFLTDVLYSYLSIDLILNACCV